MPRVNMLRVNMLVRLPGSIIYVVLRNTHNIFNADTHLGTCYGDMLQRKFSPCDVPVFAKELCSGGKIFS